MVTDEPVQANLRVGLVLEALDKLAEDVALRLARRVDPKAKVVTAAMDELRVYHAPEVTQDLVFKARVNFVGRTSMEVGIRIEQAGESPIHIASSYFTMAARIESENGSECGLPLTPLVLVSALDQRRFAQAVERKAKQRQSDSRVVPTAEEYLALEELHNKQDGPNEGLLLASNMTTEGWERTYPEYENVPKTIFGGYVAHRAYMYAHICAEQVARHRALLVSINRINFYQPVRMGDKLHFLSRVTYTGQTSLEVETVITRISRDRSMTALSNSCIFRFVSVDGSLRRLPVPTVYPSTYAEDKRFLLASRRHELYKAELASKVGSNS
jgi:acyl-CoA hydrolase